MVAKGEAPAVPALRLAVPVSVSHELMLHDGTPVRLRLTRNLSSADATTGDTVDFEVLEDVTTDDVLVVARGAVALGTITDAEHKRRMARGGKLDVAIDSVRLIDGEKVALRGVKETSGGGHTGAMTGGIVAAAIVAWPAAPFFLFMHGKDTTIPKGTEITAYTDGEIKLDRQRLLAKQPAPVSDPGQPAAPLPQAPATPSSAAPAAAQAQTAAPVAAPEPAGTAAMTRSMPLRDEMQQDIGIFLEKGLHLWSRDDVDQYLGKPVGHRLAFDDAHSPNGDVLTYPDPTARYQRIELTFESTT